MREHVKRVLSFKEGQKKEFERMYNSAYLSKFEKSLLRVNITGLEFEIDICKKLLGE